MDRTPPGQKKDLSHAMEAEYHPSSVEAAWYAWWEASGFFKADAHHKKGKKFVMVIPPPNVTGSLHIGHALTNSIEDTVTRWHRMRGEETLWVPGCDHAGIATQTVVEKMIMAKEGKTRHDYGREEFVKTVWKWKEEYGGKIYHQLRKLGSSLDWSREAFTMAPMLSRAVEEAFVRMSEMGLIYRATRLVNWCPRLNSAISDIEVDHITLEGRVKRSVPGHKSQVDFGYIASFAYKIKGGKPDEEIVVATTRIETMLGDTAVAVHPDDPRYSHFHGKFVEHPFFPERKVPIVLDPVLVDMNFGTGSVKITPAHDPNDFLCGQRHGLEFVTVFTEGGAMAANCGEFAGMMRFDARVAITEALKAKGLFRGEKPNPMRLGVCSRTGDIIEPMLKPQWYVDCKDMAAKAAEAVRAGELKLIPDFHNSTWFNFLDNSRDWCISRQLWWGHRVPAYLATVKGQPAPDASQSGNWFVARSAEEAVKLAAAKLGADPKDVTVEQDPDVLDTWFSSGLFPFSVMGWPDQTPDMEAFFPTSLLETGSDILFFWVARMVMMSLTLTGKLPFSEVFLHAIVRDAHGRKMSKSLGNVIDPLDVITGVTLETLHSRLEKDTNIDKAELERAKTGQAADYPTGIPECGTDAMRFALVAYSSQGRSINLDISRVVGYRQFCNKIWNATRFAMSNLGAGYKPAAAELAAVNRASDSPRDRWILDRLHAACEEANTGFATYDFGVATTACYNFWLYALCDVYLEAVKPVFRGEDGPAKERTKAVLYECFDRGLRLLHPFMPFVTEELWQRLTSPAEERASIMLAPYPEPVASWSDPALAASFKTAQEVVKSIRVARDSYNLTKERPPVVLVCTGDARREALETFSQDIANLGQTGPLTVQRAAPETKGLAVTVVNEETSILMDVASLIDVDAEVKKLNKKLETINESLKRLHERMALPTYDKTPQQVKEQEAARLQTLTKEAEAITQSIADLQKNKK